MEAEEGDEPDDIAEAFKIKGFYLEGFSNYLGRFEMEAEEGDEPDDIAEAFKIKGNLFDYEKPLCKAFNDFNYLFKIDMDLFTFHIQGIRS
nr:hypothetical protein [Tanacetum cinerariifolium]